MYQHKADKEMRLRSGIEIVKILQFDCGPFILLVNFGSHCVPTHLLDTDVGTASHVPGRQKINELWHQK